MVYDISIDINGGVRIYLHVPKNWKELSERSGVVSESYYKELEDYANKIAEFADKSRNPNKLRVSKVHKDSGIVLHGMDLSKGDGCWLAFNEDTDSSYYGHNIDYTGQAIILVSAALKYICDVRRKTGEGVGKFLILPPHLKKNELELRVQLAGNWKERVQSTFTRWSLEKMIELHSSHPSNPSFFNMVEKHMVDLGGNSKFHWDPEIGLQSIKIKTENLDSKISLQKDTNPFYISEGIKEAQEAVYFLSTLGYWLSKIE